MLVANSFDLWQKDTFFSAAEEVQKSSDIMESSYRTWLRGRREGWKPEHLDELARELQMALGTAKWQLEEFERAVRMSYRSHGDDITISRHGQFVSALEEKISLVESALKESYEVEGKKPFRWINLDEEECDDFALFLSGTLQGVTNDAVATTYKKISTKEDSKVGSRVSFKNHKLSRGKSLQELVTINEDSNCFVEQEESRFQETGDDDVIFQANKSASNHKTWSPPERSALEIIIDKEERWDNALGQSTPREKGSKSFLLNSRVEDRVGAKGVSGNTQSKMISWINQRLRGDHKCQRQQQMSPAFPVNSIRFILALLLTIFLMVPFLVYST